MLITIINIIIIGVNTLPLIRPNSEISVNSTSPFYYKRRNKVNTGIQPVSTVFKHPRVLLLMWNGPPV